jgi:hypothetical protein
MSSLVHAEQKRIEEEAESNAEAAISPLPGSAAIDESAVGDAVVDIDLTAISDTAGVTVDEAAVDDGSGTVADTAESTAVNETAGVPVDGSATASAVVGADGWVVTTAGLLASFVQALHGKSTGGSPTVGSVIDSALLTVPLADDPDPNRYTGKLLLLPDQILSEVFTDYLEIDDLARLDSAICHKRRRAEFLTILSFPHLTFNLIQSESPLDFDYTGTDLRPFARTSIPFCDLPSNLIQSSISVC